MSLKIVFMGTPEFSVPTLSALVKNKLNIVNVYTQPPQKSKRGQKINASPVEEFCKKNSLNFRNPKNLNNEEELEFFKKLSPDLVVVVAYGQIISKSFLDVVKLGFINIHASLLPKWRGAAPIQRGLMNGDKKLGISIMKIEEKLDSGPILALKELEIDKYNTFGEVEKKLSIMGADLLLESLKIIEEGSPKFINQLHAEATYAKKIDKKETKINWNLDANKVLSHIHSLSPNPGAWFMYEKERIKVLKAKISTEQASPGRVLNDNLSIGCKVDSIQILELQRQGKSRQSHKEFLLGNKIVKNSILV
jgi:methionyl-tRNA formyltransferase